MASSHPAQSNGSSGQQRMIPRDAPIYGNYASYASKRGTSLLLGDRRVGILPLSWVEGKRVLDVGCNSGQVSVELGLRGARKVVGVDIDPALVRKAATHLAFVNSLRNPLTGRENYFPVALAKEHGFLPLGQDEEEQAAGGFPANVEFVAADWVDEAIGSDEEGYDLVLALSLSKWIHLHHLDAGLLVFFAKLFRVLRPGGRLVLEPQAWSTYKDAVKKSKGGIPRDRMGQLELRPDRFAGELEKMGFRREGRLRDVGEVEVGDADQTGFDRPIEVFYKPQE